MKSMQLHIGALTCVLVLGCASGVVGQEPSPQTPRTPPATADESIPRPLPRAVEQQGDRQTVGPRNENLPDQLYRFTRTSFRFGQDYTLPAGETVRDIRTVLGAATIEGTVDRDVVVVLGRVQVASTAVIRGSLVAIGGNVTIQQGAAVGRDLIVIGGALDAPVSFSTGGEYVVVGMRGLGTVLQGISPWFTRGLLWGRLIVPSLPWMWALVGIVFFLGVVLNFIFDAPVRSAAVALTARPLSAFITGLLVLLLAGPMLILLAASVIGLIVVPFAACALVVASILGKIAVARAIGAGVLPETGEIDDSNRRALGLRSFVIGFAVLIVAYMVPLLGLLTYVTTGAFGLGAATMALFAALRRERPPARRPPEVPVGVPLSPPGVTPAPPPAGAAAELTPEPSTDWPSQGPADAVRPVAPPQPTAASAATAGELSVYARATFLDRLAAFALDCILVGIASAVLDIGRDGGFFALLLAYHIAFWAWKGTTLGGIVVGLRIVRIPGTELRFIDALVRGLSSVFSIAALGIGCFWMLQDAERQMWHDKIAGTVVVKVPRELVLA